MVTSRLEETLRRRRAVISATDGEGRRGWRGVLLKLRWKPVRSDLEDARLPAVAVKHVC